MTHWSEALHGAERACWLAELADALDCADKLFAAIHRDPRESPQALELYLRMQGARMQVHALRLRNRPVRPIEFDPKRIQTSPWQIETTV